ncbi:hypothetical protein BGZ57DRAFT_775275, partial [Hyaloscypha finlandica]
VVRYRDHFSLTIKRYRGLVSYFLTKVDELYYSLIFSLYPDINLISLKDNIANINYGFSFI